MLLVFSCLAIAAALVSAGVMVTRELAAVRQESARARTLELLALVGPAAVASADNPRALVAWHPLTAAARVLFPAESEALDRAAGRRFPFSADLIEAAHAQWSADWLAWEQMHDAEYKLKAAAIGAEIAGGTNPVGRARLEAVEREKLDVYQRRYAEYVRVSKALQGLLK